MAQLRHYPYRFGLRILRILPKLQKEGKKAFPPMPEKVKLNPLKVYTSQTFDDMWEDAGVPEVLEYIRGNKSLKIPSEWRPHLLPQPF